MERKRAVCSVNRLFSYNLFPLDIQTRFASEFVNKCVSKCVNNKYSVISGIREIGFA